MDNITEYIHSGLLELYVLGETTEEENAEIYALSLQHPEINNEIEAIIKALQSTAEACAPPMNPATRALVLATIDFTERISNGETPMEAPFLSKNSSIKDFASWLQRADMQLSENFQEVEAKIINATPEVSTLIVWLQHGSPTEIHEKEYEHFLLVEGSCDIQIGEEITSLLPGDYLSIPLYVPHSVTVTSTTICKVILQRVAA